MPRRKVVAKRYLLPDPKYGDKLVSRFISSLMSDGKKSLAERTMYQALDLVASKTDDDPLEVFKKAVTNVKPVLEVKSRRVGGSTYQVPLQVRTERSSSLSIRWLISYAKARGEKSMIQRLAGELLDAANNRGAAVKKKEDTHKMAEANKAFAHYGW